MFTAYSRRKGDYVYDIHIYEEATPQARGRLCAEVVNLERLESGRTVQVNAELQEFGATPDEAFSRMEAAVEEWVNDQTVKMRCL